MKLRTKLASLALCFLCAAVVRAGTVTLSDETFSVTSFDSSSSTIALRWGIYDNGVFTQLLGDAYNASNSGYVDFSEPELAVVFTQNNNANIAPGTQLALAVINIGETAAYSASAAKAVLVDASWLAPTFTVASSNVYSFSANTSAVIGTYSFNGGNDIIALSAIPEPATAAALLGVAAIGFCGFRRRRTAA